VRATAQEVAATRPGDDLVSPADVVMDRAFTVDASPEQVWPWLQQLGKRRAGWYFTRSVERVIPPGRRAIRELDPRWQRLQVGDVIPDYGGAHETFEVARIEPPTTLVYRSRRGRTDVTWSITLSPKGPAGSRVHLRLRLSPVRRKWLAGSIGGVFDLLTIAGMAAGLRERLHDWAQ
jgi:Polyketide cyclase / dehydrase and lipid transport